MTPHQRPSHPSLSARFRRRIASRGESFCAISASERFLLAPGAALISNASKALADIENQKKNDRLTRGDVAILQLLAAAELIEADLWQQYSELGGVDSPESGYRAGLEILDEDQPQYIADNTDDEMSHAAFLNAYLESKGEEPVDLSQFATLEPSQVSFVPQTTAYEP
jgi:hypothetical protein